MGVNNWYLDMDFNSEVYGVIVVLDDRKAAIFFKSCTE